MDWSGLFKGHALADMLATIFEQQVVDPWINSVVDHNTPESLENVIESQLTHTAFGATLIAQLGIALAMQQLDPILRKYGGDKVALKANLKLWAHGRLHSPEFLHAHPNAPA